MAATTNSTTSIEEDDIVPSIRSFANPESMHKHMYRITKGGKTIRNYFAQVEDMTREKIIVETELFPKDALEFYTRFNLDILDIQNSATDAALYAKFYTPARGGGQGDYRDGIQTKLLNVIDCLTKYPLSKRAVLTIPNRNADHSVDGDAKCLRELHFYLDPLPSTAASGEGETSSSSSTSSSTPLTEQKKYRLGCMGFMRAQAASIYPKNIHFIGTIMHRIADGVGAEVGSYTHCVTTLVDGRET